MFVTRAAGKNNRSALTISTERAKNPVWDAPARGAVFESLLVADEFLGEKHPETEQSDESSGGYYDYHSEAPSEFVMAIVSPQVVTRRLHGC